MTEIRQNQKVPLHEVPIVPALIVRAIEGADIPHVTELVRSYYREDQKVEFEPDTFRLTCIEFSANASKGRIDVLQIDKTIIGYSILVPFWSNEYGGNILFLDEIFVQKEHRGRRYGGSYIASLVSAPPYKAVAIQLEVTDENVRARKLYERLGFKEYPNQALIRELQ
jgi:ribosomal protein S18 acetylase RimI-like enzyme